ncbi:hypothetical protein ACIA98_35870 [Streptomyces sp. NPDC051366]
MTSVAKYTGKAAAGVVKCVAFWGHDGKALAAFCAAALGWKVTQTFG